MFSHRIGRKRDAEASGELVSAKTERLTPARLRKPSLAAAAMHGGWTLFVESFKRYALSKRVVVMSLLFAVPSALILLVRAVGKQDALANLEKIQDIERARSEERR